MLENLTVKTRFAILIGLIIIAEICILTIDTINFNSTIHLLNTEYINGVENIQKINDIRDIYSQNVLETTYLVQNGAMPATQALDSIKEANAKVKDMWATYLKDLNNRRGLTTINTTQLDRLEHQMKEIAAVTSKLQDVLRHDDRAKSDTKDIQVLIPPILQNLSRLNVWEVEGTISDFQSAVSSIMALRTYLLLIIIITSIFVIGLAIWMAIGIISQLKKAVDVIHKLTLGDFSFQTEEYSTSELGQLLQAMESLGISNKKMSDTLLDVSNGNLAINVQPRSDKDSLGLALVSMIKNLRHITGEIQKEVLNLTTSSREIVASISQIAAASAETAAAITETSTSVEELKQTAHLNYEKAKDVLNSSEETFHIVGTSEKLLKSTSEDMYQISDKMRVISDDIVKLSGHSQTIRDIVDTVNDLAEQSNLLAVNAAIEAARAGEHGKSFAVVAHEIRTLAEQSKAATIQVRSILNEIQNSTSAAVLATEQGAKAVENGVKQTAQTNESMQALSMSMTRVTQAANQIAISSQQQSSGVEKVTFAMSNVNDATTQLIDHMKQIETAVTSLNSIGENLKDMTDHYILSQDDLQYMSSDISR